MSVFHRKGMHLSAIHPHTTTMLPDGLRNHPSSPWLDGRETQRHTQEMHAHTMLSAQHTAHAVPQMIANRAHIGAVIHGWLM